MPAAETDIMKNHHYGNPITSPRKKVRHFNLKKNSLCQFWTIISYQCHRAVPRSKVKKSSTLLLRFLFVLVWKKIGGYIKLAVSPRHACGAPKKKYFFLQKSYFYLKRVQKFFDQIFFYKGDPLKKWEFFKKKFFAFVNFENIHFVKIS